MSEDGTAADVAFDEYPNVTRVEPNGFGYPQEQYRNLRPLHPPTDMYPQEDFTPGPLPPSRPHWFLRFYRMLRKLIRQRQESVVVKSVKWQAADSIQKERKIATDAYLKCKIEIAAARVESSKEIATLTKRIEQRDIALSELRQKMELKVEELATTIASRERDIKDYVERDIPKLQRELEVSRAEVKYWKTLVAEKLIHEEAQIAVDNKRITDAEAVIEQIRNSATIAQLMNRAQ